MSSFVTLLLFVLLLALPFPSPSPSLGCYQSQMEMTVKVIPEREWSAWGGYHGLESERKSPMEEEKRRWPGKRERLNYAGAGLVQQRPAEQ